MADIFAYEATGPGSKFGVIDLSTGVFTSLGDLGWAWGQGSGRHGNL